MQQTSSWLNSGTLKADDIFCEHGPKIFNDDRISLGFRYLTPKSVADQREILRATILPFSVMCIASRIEDQSRQTWIWVSVWSISYMALSQSLDIVPKVQIINKCRMHLADGRWKFLRSMLICYFPYSNWARRTCLSIWQRYPKLHLTSASSRW